jgi:hypothetical protein
MTAKSPVLNRLKSAAAKAAARAAAAKEQVREAKAQLKVARKLFKAEKKAAKQARRKVDAAVQKARPVKRARVAKAAAIVKPSRKAASGKLSGRGAKPALQAPDSMRSAAEVAKSVIERLHAPPPALPPEPIIPANNTPTVADPHGAAPRS